MSSTVVHITGVGSARPSSAAGAQPADDLSLGADDLKALRHAGVETVLLAAAARQALDASKPVGKGDRLGVVIATQSAGHAEFATMFDRGRESSSGRVAPAKGPHVGPNAPAAQLAILLDARGPNITVTAGARSLVAAVDLAEAAIVDGDADVMLVGAVDAGFIDPNDTEGAFAFVVEAAPIAGEQRPLRSVRIASHQSFVQGHDNSQQREDRAGHVLSAVLSVPTHRGVVIVDASDDETGRRLARICNDTAAQLGWSVVERSLVPHVLAGQIADLLAGSEGATGATVRIDGAGEMAIMTMEQHVRGVE